MSALTLQKTNFPLYTVDVLDKDHFVIAGGGGSAKTGVPNALVSLDIICKYINILLLCVNGDEMRLDIDLIIGLLY